VNGRKLGVAVDDVGDSEPGQAELAEPLGMTEGEAIEREEVAAELPIVARMVIEIRSDGTRTVARGAIEDSLAGEQVAVEAEAGSPLELSRALTKMVLSAPFAALLRRGKPEDSLLQTERVGLRDGVREGVREGLGALKRELGQRLGQRLDRTSRGRTREPDDG
jgi:hypothetical protein